MADPTKLDVTQEDRDGIRFIRIRQGSLGWEVDAKVLKQALQQAISGTTRAAVDLGDVSYLGSPTIGTILSFSRRAEKAGCKVVLYGLQPNVRDVFKVLHLPQILDICDTEEEAIALLGT